MIVSKSVLIAMSGGVDSSVAAALLIERGWKVTGATMRLWDYAPQPGLRHKFCCSLQDSMDAAFIASMLGIQHHTIDLKEHFMKAVVDDFVSEYSKGRTPNPCIRCNSLLKWGALWDKKNELGLDYFATGHYARVLKTDGDYALFRAKNRGKDQSYALWQIPQAKLKNTVLPLGEIGSKDDVRRKAEMMGLPAAKRPESQEVCFIPDDDYASFLKNAGVESKPGDIVDKSGDILGRHQGVIHYTVGQRKGLGGGYPQPMYVSRIDPLRSLIYIGPREDIIFRKIEVRGVNWLVNPIPDEEFEAEVKIRYRDPGQKAVVKPIGDDGLSIHFPEGAEAPTSGQSAVVYIGGRVVCGGIIESANR